MFSFWPSLERLHFHFSLSCIGEGNGNPLPCSCLENPRDRGAWWAAVYGVIQNQTRLKRLSSSSSSSNKPTQHLGWPFLSNAEEAGLILGWEDSLKKEMVTHSNILACEIPWTEEPYTLRSMGLQRAGHD